MELETYTVDTLRVACDGGGGPLGHPKVFLQIDPDEREIVCPYCSRHFKLADDAKVAAGGH